MLKYGSDPLKTYLPDSDIDITVLCKKSCPYPLATQLPIAQLKAIKNELQLLADEQEEQLDNEE